MCWWDRLYRRSNANRRTAVAAGDGESMAGNGVTAGMQHERRGQNARQANGAVVGVPTSNAARCWRGDKRAAVSSGYA
jgi:hypothetical protein